MCIIITLYSFQVFIDLGPTAYEVPAIDIAHYLERYFDFNFAPNDFLINSYEEFNPRHIFIFIFIFISKIFSVHWYEIFFLFKILIVIFLPLTHYLLIYTFLKKKIFTKIQFFVISTSLCLFICYLIKHPSFMSIAWWDSMQLKVIPQSLSFILCSGSIIILNSNNRIFILTSYILFIIGCTIHPAIGLFFSVIYLFFNVYRFQYFWKQITNYFLISICLSLLINSLITNDYELSAEEFTYHYAFIGHSSHYIIKYFENFSEPWFINYIYIMLIYLIALVYGKIRNFKMMVYSIFLILGHFGALFLQYFTTEIYPVKLITALGPVRFLMFSSIFIPFSIAWLLIDISKGVKINLDLKALMDIRFVRVTKKSLKIKTLVIFYLILILFIHQKFLDSPFETKENSMLDWIKNETENNSVFISFSKTVDINLKARRSLFITQEFPFNQNKFREFSKRYISVYGSRSEIEDNPGFWSGEKHNKYYHSLSPKYFLTMSSSYKINYLVFENKYINKDFLKFESSYSDSLFTVYNLKLIN